MKIKFTYLVFIALIIGGCGYTAWKIVNRPPSPKSVSVVAIRAQNGIPVTLLEIKPSKWMFWLPLYGTVKTPRLSQVSAAQQEYVIDIRVEVGDRITKGQVLALLDNKTSLEKVEAARAKNAELESKYNRLVTLRNAGGTSNQDVEAAYTNYRDAQANLRSLSTELARLKVIAPINGVLVRRDAEVGQLASPSSPLFEIADTNQIEVTLDVAPSASSVVKPGMSAEVKHNGGWLPAVVRRINPLADESTGLYNCVIKVDVPDDVSLLIGSTVECRILTENLSDAISLPYEMVRDIDGQSVVFVASGDIAVKTPVERGRVFDQRWRILSGVKSGDMLVRKGVDRMYDGAKIWVQQPLTVSGDAGI